MNISYTLYNKLVNLCHLVEEFVIKNILSWATKLYGKSQQIYISMILTRNTLQKYLGESNYKIL